MFQISLNQINPSSIRMAISWFMIFSHYGGDASPGVFHACYEIKKKLHFYYFSSRTRGPSHFVGKPPSVDGKWQKKFFIVTPQSNKWPFPYGQWHYEAVIAPDRVVLANISSHNHSVFKRLNDYVGVGSKNKLFKINDLVRNEKLLHHFGFFNPAESPSPSSGIYVPFLALFFFIFVIF